MQDAVGRDLVIGLIWELQMFEDLDAVGSRNCKLTKLRVSNFGKKVILLFGSLSGYQKVHHMTKGRTKLTHFFNIYLS